MKEDLLATLCFLDYGQYCDTMIHQQKDCQSLRSTFERQTRHLLRVLLEADCERPEDLTGVDDLARGRAWPRIRAMLQWVASGLFSDPDAHDRSPSFPRMQRDLLFDPLLCGNGKNAKATCGAMLAILAIVHSHDGWSQPYFHDAHSAAIAGATLSCVELPCCFPGLVATLVLFQTVFRTCLADWSEVLEWTGNEPNGDDTRVRPLVVQEFWRLWMMARDGTTLHRQGDGGEIRAALAALALSSLAYEHRSGRLPADHEKWVRKDAGARSLLDQRDIERLSKAHERRMLVVFEYAHKVLGGKDALVVFAANALGTEFEALKREGLPPVLWFSFGRSTPRLFHGVRAELRHSRGLPSGWQVEREILVETLCRVRRIAADHAFYRSEIDPTTKCKIAFGDSASPLDAWSIIHVGLKRFWSDRGEQAGFKRYLPVPVVSRILRTAREIRPGDFVVARIRRLTVEPKGIPCRGQTFALPNTPPDSCELEALAKRCKSDPCWTEDRNAPKLIVARVLAATILNYRMAFGGGRFALEIDALQSVVEGWQSAVEIVAKWDSHDKLRKYLDEVCAVHHKSLAENRRKLSEVQEGQYVLGVDVGAGSIKVKAWPLDDNCAFDKLEKACAAGAYSVPKDQDALYEDGLDFATTLRGRILRDENFANASHILNKVAIIGVCWPGAVRDEGVRSHVAGGSGILRAFEGHSGRGGVDDPRTIHRLCLLEGFEEAFCRKASGAKGPTVPPFVCLLNDGEAHTRVSKAMFERIFRDEAKPTRPTVVLTAGTGTALGVLEADSDKIAPLLTEAGKMVLDIGEGFGNGFPAGVANKLFSKNMLRDQAQRAADGIGRNPAEEACAKKLTDQMPIQALEIGAQLAGLKGVKGSPPSGPDESTRLWKQWWKEHLEPLTSGSALLRARLEAGDATRDRKSNLLLAFEDYVFRERWPRGTTAGDEAQFYAFVLHVARRAGRLFADLAVMVLDLVDAEGVLATGGPMSGSTGYFVRGYAREELEDTYGLIARTEPPSASESGSSEIFRRIYFPEPHEGTPSNAARGAADAALEQYRKRIREQWATAVDLWIGHVPVGTEVRVTADPARRIWPPIGPPYPSLAGGAIALPIPDALELGQKVEDYLRRNSTRLGLLVARDTGREQLVFTRLSTPNGHLV